MKRTIVSLCLGACIAATVFISYNAGFQAPSASGSVPISSDILDSNQVKPLSERSARRGVQAEIDQLEASVHEKRQAMDDLLADSVPIDASSDYIETPEQAAEFEALLAQVEKATGEPVELPPSGSVPLDPSVQQEYRELDQKLEDLDREMQEIVNQL